MEWVVSYADSVYYLLMRTDSADIPRRGQPQRRTGLLQIAHKEAGLLLYSVPRGESQLLPPSILQYLASNEHVKAGVAIMSDIKKLARDFESLLPNGLVAEGILELSTLAKYVDPERWASQSGPLISLQNLVAHYCELHLRKGDERTMSNWEGYSVNDKALQYAAGDVIATVAALDVLYQVRVSSTSLTVELRCEVCRSCWIADRNLGLTTFSLLMVHQVREQLILQVRKRSDRAIL